MLRATPLLALAILTLPASALDDTCATAEPVNSPPGATLVFPNRTLGPADLLDHYRVVVDPGVELELFAWFVHAQGNVDLRLWNADCTIVLAQSLSVTDDELLAWTNQGAGPVQVVCEALLAPPANGTVEYDMGFSSTLTDCTFDDDWEENDTCATARVLPFAHFEFETGRVVRQGDDDYYSLTVPPNTSTTVRVQYDLAGGDIDARLLDDDCATVISTSATSGFESLLLDNPSLSPRTYVVHVYLADATACNDYAFGMTAGTGYNYCTSAPNSSGHAAVMYGYGSASVSGNDLVLRAAQVPDNAIGIFYYGRTEASFPFGNGTRCVGPGVVRSPIAFEYKGGLDWQVDYAALAGSALPVHAGLTYHFQAWFRDPAAGGAAFDLSDGYRVTFRP